MFDLEKHVTDAVRALVENGKLAAMVETHVAKLLDSILGDALRSYGDVGKQIGEAVKQAIAIDPQALGLEGYNLTVLAIVKQKLDAAIQKVGVEKLSKDMDELLGTHAPETIKLSELVEQFKAWASQTGNEICCTVILEEPQYHHRWLYLDAEPRKKWNDCRFALMLGEDGHTTIFKVDGRDPKQTIIMGPLYGFEKTLFQMYAAGTKIIVDETEFDDSLERDGEDW